MEQIEQYSVDWYVKRRGKFSGSEWHRAMTEPRTKSKVISDGCETYILEKVWENLSGELKTNIDTMATQWGVENEPKAVEWYTKLTGNATEEAGCYINEEYPAVCSPDRLTLDNGLIEVKCPFNGANHLKHCTIINDEDLKYNHKEYYWQMMFYMWFLKKDYCDFVSFDPRIDSDLGLFVYRLNSNNEAFEAIENRLKTVSSFYNEFLSMFKKKIYTKTNLNE